MRVYVAGPMTGYPDHNRAAFRKASALLRDEYGLEVLSPDEFDESHPLVNPQWADYLRRDLREGVLLVEALVCLPGWRASRGALLEVTVAAALGLLLYEFQAEPGGGLGRLRELDRSEIPTPGMDTT